MRIPISWRRTDAGTIPNLKFSFATARNRLAAGGWAREVTVRELPVATTLAGVNMRLTSGGIRLVPCIESQDQPAVSSETLFPFPVRPAGKRRPIRLAFDLDTDAPEDAIAPKQAPFEGPALQSIGADIHDEDAVAAAIAGAYGVVNAVSLYRERGTESFHGLHASSPAQPILPASKIR